MESGLERCNPTSRKTLDRTAVRRFAPQHDKSVNGFKRNPLTALRRRHEQGAPAMLHAGSMIPNVDRAQEAHSNTVLARYRFTLRGALVSSGRQ